MNFQGWVTESSGFAGSTAYGALVPNGTVTPAYVSQGATLARKRVALLNAIWPAR